MGPLKRKESERLVRLIRDASPGFLFVALGAPRQDIWIQENLRKLNVPCRYGCRVCLRSAGWCLQPRSTLDAGRWPGMVVSPVREPRRLWRRYIVNDLPVFGRLLLTGRRSAESVAVAST